jgi:hypothetical protein
MEAKNMSNASAQETDRQVVMAFFPNETLAASGLEALIE